MKREVLIPIDQCIKCPFCKTSRTKGAGYALDYTCKEANRLIVGYVELNSEMPQKNKIPEWCPFEENQKVLNKLKSTR